MNGAAFLAEVIGTRAIRGLGVGSSVGPWDSALPVEFLDIGREAGSDMFRRDYGLVEVIFTGGEPWTCDSFGVQAHRLAHAPEMLREWLPGLPADRSAVAWSEVSRELGHRPDAPAWKVRGEGDMIHYRSDTAGVSVFVLADEAADPDSPPRPGDIWSVMIGPRATVT